MASKISIPIILVAPLVLLLFLFPVSADARRGKPSTNIVVDPSGRRRNSFSTIQAAVDSVPNNNNNWVTISVKAGVYKEQVKIPAEKEFIYLKGQGMGRSVVTWDAHATMLASATFECLADNVFVSGISFVNSYNYPPNRNQVVPALAAKISGDKIAIYKSRFSGYQDTLLDDAGRHYFKECTIEGAIDFIFGGGQSIYEECKISVNVGTEDPGSTGFIAAQARDEEKDSGGFVFIHCNVTGEGKAFLGRAWKSYSRAIYYQSYLSDIIVPFGWDSWFYAGHENIITFAEEECTGPGSNMSSRVTWEKKLSQNEVQQFTSMSYIDSEGWMQKLPEKIQG